jgi:anti-anti-sigma factor
MNCFRTSRHGHVTLRIVGALDALTVLDLREVFDSVVAERPRRVVLDFGELTTLDSSGVGAIVSLFKHVKGVGGELVVVRAHGQPRVVLELLKLNRVFGLAALSERD